MNSLNRRITVPPVPVVSVTAAVGEHYDWASIILLSFLQPQLNGEHPFVRVVYTEAEISSLANGIETVLPMGAVVVRDSKSKNVLNTLAILDKVWIYYSAGRDGIRAVVSGEEASAVEAIAEEIRAAFPEPPEPDESTVPIHIWHQGSNGGTAQRRRLEVPNWAEIAANYPQPVRSQLDELMSMNRPESNGRLILWHGVPGTGKTTAIRALMSAWANWCDAQYVIDPEVAFADPSYLTDLMTREFSNSRHYPWLDDDHDYGGKKEDENTRWRLLIAEDSDEFLRADARQSAGAALGRLLNLSDGILGQGSHTLILLTTNEDMRELHPALVRPGRALAKTEFTKFGIAAANAWLMDQPTVNSPKTLAELYELRGETKRIGDAPAAPQHIGFGV